MTAKAFALVEINADSLNDTDRPVYEWLAQRFGAAPLEFKRLFTLATWLGGNGHY